MRIVISGATGFVGQHLVKRLRAADHDVVAISRKPQKAKDRLNISEAYDWASLDGAFAKPLDAVVHLAGESVQGLWTQAKIKEVWDSRIRTTTSMVEAIMQADHQPSVLMSASGIGYFGEGGETALHEDSPPGEDYFAKLCVEWESLVLKADLPDVRRVATRFGIILGQGGGALGAMALPAKTGLSGALGTGKQWWSWVSIDDAVAALECALFDEQVSGPLNVVAPMPIRQIDFQRALCEVLGRPCVVPAPAFAVRLMLGRFATEVLSSKRVEPRALQSLGFDWSDPELKPLFEKLL